MLVLNILSLEYSSTSTTYLGVIKLQGCLCHAITLIRVYWVNWIPEINVIWPFFGAKQETNHPTAIKTLTLY